MRRQDSICNSVLKDGERLLDWMKNVDELAIFARKYNLYSENEDMICRWYVCGASRCKKEEMKESVFHHIDKCVLKSNCSQEIKDEYLRVKNPTLIDRLKKVGLKILRKTISFLLDLMN